jgi:hypothetical protein
MGKRLGDGEVVLDPDPYPHHPCSRPPTTPPRASPAVREVRVGPVLEPPLAQPPATTRRIHAMASWLQEVMQVVQPL